ncbi:hypothetical protein FRC20_008314 [Serendipita sp. 405]|nr:hypothetical protein FRC20_008314 [Serendipita sp. 405]
MVMIRSTTSTGSSSGTPLNNQGAPLPGGGGGNAIAPDDEFKAYTRTYDATITRAHQLAREYHHLPPSKRDRQGYEKVGRAFAEAAKVSRVQWTLRCELEKERLETLLSPPPSSSKEEKKERKRQVEAEANGEYTSLHRIAGARAREGWEYASMLAEAWGVSEDVAVKEPLEEMAVLKPKR